MLILVLLLKSLSFSYKELSELTTFNYILILAMELYSKNIIFKVKTVIIFVTSVFKFLYDIEHTSVKKIFDTIDNYSLIKQSHYEKKLTILINDNVFEKRIKILECIRKVIIPNGFAIFPRKTLLSGP